MLKFIKNEAIFNKYYQNILKYDDNLINIHHILSNIENIFTHIRHNFSILINIYLIFIKIEINFSKNDEKYLQNDTNIRFSGSFFQFSRPFFSFRPINQQLFFVFSFQKVLDFPIIRKKSRFLRHFLKIFFKIAIVKEKFTCSNGLRPSFKRIFIKFFLIFMSQGGSAPLTTPRHWGNQGSPKPPPLFFLHRQSEACLL